MTNLRVVLVAPLRPPPAEAYSEGVAVVSKDQWEIGNQMGVLKEDYIETLEWLSDELEEEFGDPAARIPIDKPGCGIVYTINPREVKYDPRTISDAARIFYVAGESWTMPSDGWDMTNFGLFSGDDALGGAVARRVYEQVRTLGGRTLVMSECGHGYRSTRCEGPNWAGEDIEFEYRLQLAGARFKWVRHQAIQYHLYHEQKVVTPGNVDLVERTKALGRAACAKGLRNLENLQSEQHN